MAKQVRFKIDNEIDNLAHIPEPAK